MCGQEHWPHTQIENCVRFLGVRQAKGLAQRAFAIYREGSMLTVNGSHRKWTLGGIFFVLVKSRCSARQYELIFDRSHKVPVTKRKKSPAAASILKSVLAKARRESR